MRGFFQKGIFWYNIKQGKISFVKVFWVGFIVKAVIEMMADAKYIDIIIAFPCLVVQLIIWLICMWYSRKNVSYPIWFYIGFGLPIAWEGISFIISFMVSFMTSFMDTYMKSKYGS